MDINRLVRIGQQHHGVVPRSEAELSTGAWYRALDSGVLVAIHPGVARLVGSVPTPQMRIAAAVLAAGPTALASHRSAVRLWGIERPSDDEPVDVIVTERAGARHLSGVVTHRPRDQHRLHPPLRRQNIRCTNVLRALCDLGAVDAPSVTDAVIDALSQRLVTLDALLTTVIEHSEHGRHGIVALREAVDSCAIDAKPADSVLEAAMARLVDVHRVPEMEFHPIIEGWEVDFRVLGTRVLIECDGWTTHGLQREQFERDRRRDAMLSAAGWITVRLTYRTIIIKPAATATQIRSVVKRWAGNH